VIKKLFLKQEEKLNQKYFKKTTHCHEQLMAEIVSPKTYQAHCS
jgi:hypothetical protein